MSYIEVEYPHDADEFYAFLCEQLKLYADGEDDLTAILANASSVIAQALEDVNWVGFYIVKGKELVLGPFQGKPAVSRIGYGLGVCGASWRDDCAVIVDDVGCFEGHIACDCGSRSEIVVPMRKPDGSFFGVLDIDSQMPSRFSVRDRDGLADAVKVIEDLIRQGT